MSDSPRPRHGLLLALTVLGIGIALPVLLSRLFARDRAPDAPPRDAPLATPPRLPPSASRFETLATAAGPVRVARADLAYVSDEALRAAARLAQDAGRKATEDEPWRLETSPACGWFLRDVADRVRVLPTAVLEREWPDRRPSDDERGALARSALRLVDALGEDLAPGSRRAVGHVLKWLSLPDQDPDSTELNPGYARLIVASGWLTDVAPGADPDARAALQRDLATAMRQQAVDRWKGEGHEMVRVTDAWGVGGTVYRAPERTVLIVTPPPPMGYGSAGEELSRCRTVIELPAGADPVADPAVVARAVRVTLLRRDRMLVSWSAEGGTEVDEAAWRAVFPARRGGWDPDAFPPHVVLAGPDRAVHGLIVAEGVLRPVRDRSPEEAERFLEDAARLLPDAAHIDLLEQYVMKWVYDSPDSTCPLIVGCEDAHGDIHQTAPQVLATTAGGIARGDCDDFAELAWAIAKRQGRPAHVLSVPGHLAAVWADHGDDGWSVHVLQTGPVLEIRDADLPSALYRTYACYEDTDPVDVDALPVAIRFDGESMRNVHSLSWRIFAEPDYAATLIDVQRDWHRYTFLRGSVRMRGLIGRGDRDPANYAELAALYAWSGRYHEAAATYRLASRHARDPEGRLLRLVDCFGALLGAERRGEAVALARDICERQLPAASETWGSRGAHVALTLATGLARYGEPEEAARLLAAALQRPLERGGPTLELLASGEAGDDQWGSWSERKIRRRLLIESGNAALAVLENLGDARGEDDESVRAVARHLETWMRLEAFQDLETERDALVRWAAYGRWLALEEPEGFLDRLEQAALPSQTVPAEQPRAARLRDPSVLSWVRASPYTWTGRLAELVADHDRRPDPALVRRLGALLEESVRAAHRLGCTIPDTEGTVHGGRLQVALLTGDEARLRERLRRVARLGDNLLRETTAGVLGSAAPLLDLDAWRRVFACWVE